MSASARDAISYSGSLSRVSPKLMPIVVIRHGRARPLPPPASSTNPYLASWRRWNEQVVGDSPIRSPSSVAVSAPPMVSSSISASRTGCDSARSVRASVISRRWGSDGEPDCSGWASFSDTSRE